MKEFWQVYIYIGKCHASAELYKSISFIHYSFSISGVIDDRGKFIYISHEEMQSVARFIRQRGRVSISDLVESSNQLIELAAPKKAVAVNW